MVLKVKEIINQLKWIETYMKTSIHITSGYKNFVRFLSTGNGVLQLIVNNFDIKCIQYVSIENEKFDRIYIIEEIANIFNNMKSYETIELMDDHIITDDSDISLVSVSIDEQEKDVVFCQEQFFDSKGFKIDEYLINEMSTNLSILALKNKENVNYYFTSDKSMYFDFFDIKAEKSNVGFDYINSDIYTYKLTYDLFKNNNSQLVSYKENKETNEFTFCSNNFYFVGHNIKIDNNTQKFIKDALQIDDVICEFDLKLEFANFCNIVNNFESKGINVVLIFAENLITVQSGMTEFTAEFNYEGNCDGIVCVQPVNKMLQFLLKYGKINKFHFKIIKNSAAKFLTYDEQGLKVLVEIM